MTQAVLPGYLNSAEAAAELGITMDYLKRLRYLGRIAYLTVGRFCIYKTEDIRRYRDDHPELGSRLRATD